MADSFFSLDGQERTRALKNAEASLGEFLNYYLGPTGIPERLGLVSQGVDMMSPASAMNRSMQASGEGRYLDSAIEGVGVVAPAGIAGYLAKIGKRAVPLVATAIDEAEAGVRALFAADMMPGQAPDAPVAQTAPAPAPEPLAPPPAQIDLPTANDNLLDDDLIDVEDIDWEPDDAYWDAQEAMLARETPVQQLLARLYEGQPLTAAEQARVQEYRTQQEQLLNQQLGPTLDEMGPADPAFFPPDPDDFPPVPQAMPSPAASRFSTPIVGSQEGLASLYSPTRKAVDLLDRPTYDNIDSLRVQLLNRGAKPDEVARVMDRLRGVNGPISREQLAQAADEQAGELFVRRVNADNTKYGAERNFVTGYFVGGADDIQANVIEVPTSSAPGFAEEHFSGSRGTPIVHTRTGRLWSDRVTSSADDPDSYHVGEIQSDWAQRRAKLFVDDNALKAARERHRVVLDESEQLYADMLQREQELISMGEKPYDDPEIADMLKRISKLTDERESLFNKIDATQTHGFRGDFDAKYPDAPGHVKTTDKWVQLALRQSLVDAVNSGARQMSLSTGDMVKSYTFGKLEGQKKFYDGVVVDNLNEVLKRFAKEAGIKKPEVEMAKVFGKEGEEYTVPVVRFTDEFKEAVRRVGLPAFAKGGEVKGQKGLGYLELLADNIIGLDNEYESFGESLGKAINEDEIGFLKNAGIGLYEGAKQAVMNPLTTAEELIMGVYDAGSDLFTQDLNDRLLEMYGVTFDQATDEQVSRAREAVFGDAATVASVLPPAKALEKGTDAASIAIDAAQRRQAEEFFRSIEPEFDPKAAAGSRFFYPSRDEAHNMLGNPTAMEQLHMEASAKAKDMLTQGFDPSIVYQATGVLPVPLRDSLGVDHGYRLIAAMDDLEFDAIRPHSVYNIDVVMDPTLSRSEGGYFKPTKGGGTKDYTIGLNPALSGSQRAKALTHELTHADLTEGDIGWSESGMNEDMARLLKADAVDQLKRDLKNASSEAEKAEIQELLDEIMSLTPFELYSRTPGEMLARLSEGDTTMARRLKALELANPYLSPDGKLRRYTSAILSGVFGKNYHAAVPMDLSKAIIADPIYYPQNPAWVVDASDVGSQAPDPFKNVGSGEIPFAKGGVVKGSLLDIDIFE